MKYFLTVQTCLHGNMFLCANYILCKSIPLCIFETYPYRIHKNFYVKSLPSKVTYDKDFNMVVGK